jgi:fructosamine-3-kinase
MSLSLEFMHQVAASIMATSNERTISLRVTSIGGGGISASFRLSIGERDYFLKTNKSDRLPMFEAEMAALKEITTIGAVRAPIPICTGVAEGHSFLALEWLVFHPLDQAAAMRLGRAMAALHRHTAPQFGWHRQNTIGATPQINTYTSDWPAFWKEYRLGFQLRLAERNGYLGRIQDLGTQLLTRCDELFSEYTPQPSFLHGDLWHGNTACNPSGEPLIFDPAAFLTLSWRHTILYGLCTRAMRKGGIFTIFIIYSIISIYLAKGILRRRKPPCNACSQHWDSFEAPLKGVPL